MDLTSKALRSRKVCSAAKAANNSSDGTLCIMLMIAEQGIVGVRSRSSSAGPPLRH